jgi:hypothetical protein
MEFWHCEITVPRAWPILARTFRVLEVVTSDVVANCESKVVGGYVTHGVWKRHVDRHRECVYIAKQSGKQRRERKSQS